MTDATLAFVFPGQGSQSLGMLAELAQAHAEVEATFAEASDGAGLDLWRLAQDGPREDLDRTEFTQPALLAAGVAVWRVWRARGGPTPARLAGHSLGEYSALVAAGALTLGDAARLVRERGRLMQAAVPAGQGAMAAVLGAEDELVETVCAEVAGAEVVCPANYNAPGQVVVGGHAVAVERALARLAERGVRKAVRLPISVPSHTPLMREAGNRLCQAMADAVWHEPIIPVIQNVDAEVHRSVPAIRDALVRQTYLPVRWSSCVRALAEQGTTRVAECGPGKVLAGLIKRIAPTVEARAIGAPEALAAALAAWSRSQAGAAS